MFSTIQNHSKQTCSVERGLRVMHTGVANQNPVSALAAGSSINHQSSSLSSTKKRTALLFVVNYLP
jgi:hypothetical protein